MRMSNSRRRLAILTSTISAFALPFMAGGVAAAQDAAASGDDEIVVTGSRRAVSVQDVPVNIAAVGAQQIEETGVQDLTELATLVPGLRIIDQGTHASNPIIVRGLNADPLGSNDGSTDGGGTVGVYVGDIPLVVDLRLEDMERVEVLMGPQGTLYGSGTLGGAIRYIPTRPQFGEATIGYRADVYSYSEGDDLSNEVGMTFNIPVGDKFAIRGVIDRLEDSGFIDYNYIVQEPGVSESDLTDFNDPAQRAANLAPVADANDEDIVSGRIAFRWAPTETYEANLTYFFQNSLSGGRQMSSHRGVLPGVDEYESTKRVRETFERNIDLLALEQTFDVGFAELTSSTGYSRIFEKTQRDQTDLLLLLNPA